jgi:energy-coupling factor transport system ATP-binding protein
VAAFIQIDQVAYRYPGGDWALKDLTVEVDCGDYAVIFGANGSGKSTFACLLNGLIPHFFGGSLQGTARVDGLNTVERTPADFFPRVGLVLQNPDAQLFCSTVEDELAFGLESLGLPEQQIGERIRSTAEALGIGHLLGRSPETLSGGEQRLVAIASVLVVDPPLLVMDEPFSNLDWTFAARVRSLLSELHRRGKTVIIIEHRTSGGFLQDAGRLAVFEQGHCAYMGAAAAAEGILAGHRLIPVYPGRPTSMVLQDGPPLLAVEHLGYAVEEKKILEDVSFELRPGEVVALVGKNGAGKSTLARHLIGLLKPSAGDVRLHGRSIRGQTTSTLAGCIGVCFQNPNDQFFKTTVRDEIGLGWRRRRAAVDTGFDEFCRSLNIDDLLDRSPYRLSEGEKKQTAIAAVLAMGPEILVLDEPTVSQDAAGKEALAARIGELAGQGIAVLVATHDLDFATACAGRWIFLDQGRVQGDGDVADIIHLVNSQRQELEKPENAAGLTTPRPARSNISPLTWLLLLVAGVGAVLSSNSSAVLSAEAALVAILLLSNLKRHTRSLKLMGSMAVWVFLLGILFFDFEVALSLLLRVFSLLGISALCFAALNPEELCAALALLKVPAGPAFMLTAGLRYVPLIEQKIRSIRSAQQARGIDLRPRLKNMGNWMALLLPLLVQSALLADELALAMEARGFSSTKRKSKPPAKLRVRDWAVMIAALCALALVVYWERGGFG